MIMGLTQFIACEYLNFHNPTSSGTEYAETSGEPSGSGEENGTSQIYSRRPS